MDPKKFSSEHIKNKMATLTSETLFSEYCFETKTQTKVVYKLDNEELNRAIIHFVIHVLLQHVELSWII